MHTDSNAIHSSPQADGDSRPFRAVQPRQLVHVEKSGPGFHPTLQQRDAAITALVEPMARLLFQALQVQALGAIDDWTFEQLPVRAKNELITEARIALHRQSPLYRDEAKRQSQVAFDAALKDAAIHYPHMNPVADDAEIGQRRRAILHVVEFLRLLRVSDVIREVHDAALSTPIRMGATAQIALTALRGAGL